MSGALQVVFQNQRSFSVGYRFVGQATDAYATVYVGSTVDSMTLITTPPPLLFANLANLGFAVNNDFLAQGNVTFSTNSGVNWTNWAGAQTYNPTNLPPAINGTIAYNPTSKIAFCYYISLPAKSSVYDVSLITVKSTGVINTTVVAVPSSTNVGSIIYSPPLNTFYIMNLGTTKNSCSYVNGTTGATSANTSTIGTPLNYRAGISHNGYPLQAVFSGSGSIYDLREYTSVDLSAYTQYATISGDQPTQAVKTPFFWAPVNNKYYHANAATGAGLITIYSATSAAPQTFTSISSFTPPSANGMVCMNFMEESGGKLWIFGIFTIASVRNSFTYYSTDSGVTWTQKSGVQIAALSKNFS